MTPDLTTDVLIVGSGIMGASVAALLREADPDVRIVMIDAGAPIGDFPGEHLHESADPEIWERYNQKVSSGIQGLYGGDETFRPVVERLEDLEPGMQWLSVLGEHADELPGAALAWNAGGMGVHWTAATPTPAQHECFGDPGRWEDDLAVARRLLRVTDAPLGPTTAGAHVLKALSRLFPQLPSDRTPRAMPMAVTAVGDRLVRTGPATIFPPIATGGDDRFTLITGTIVRALSHESASVRGAQVESLADGETYRVHARVSVVCADALRTPQLLHASGIRPSALGRYLNEHAFLSNRVLLDLERFGMTLSDLPRIAERETVTDSLWLPASAAQPLQAQIMSRPYIDDEGAPLAYGVGVSIYVPVESRPENRITFEDEPDIAGMPRMRVHFSYSEDDLVAIDRAVEVMAGIAGELGAWDRATDSRLLAPGASLHMTGTVRSGEVDDGTSVCDPSGRVWGWSGVYVAGNGVIPTAMAGNVTLPGVVTAVRAARAVAAELRSDAAVSDLLAAARTGEDRA
jgi:choline dehydrogenase-like flavoprotein